MLRLHSLDGDLEAAGEEKQGQQEGLMGKAYRRGRPSGGWRHSHGTSTVTSRGRQWNRTCQLTFFSQTVPPAATNSPKYLGHPWLKMDAHIPYRGSIHLFWAKQLLRTFSYQPEIKEPIVVGDTHERTGHPIHHVHSSTGCSCSLLVIRKASWNAAACRLWEKEEPSLFT